MPFNGSGTYLPPSLPGSFNPAVTGQPATPADWNVLLADISLALSTTITNDGQTTITAEIPFNTHRITGLGDPVDAQDAATKTYVLANPRSYLAGLTTSRSSATVLGVAAGFCIDSTNTVGITLGAFTKSTGGAWVSGTGNNGMGQSLTIGNNTWYHVFAIINGGAADVYFDTSVSAANKPASTTAFRRIGSFLTNGSAQIIAFTQTGDLFLWDTATTDINTSPAAGPSTYTLNVPSGVAVMWQGQGTLFATNTNAGSFLISLYTPGQTLTANQPNLALINFTGLQNQTVCTYSIQTNTSQQIGFIGSGSGSVTGTIQLYTRGWIDRRGRDS